MTPTTETRLAPTKEETVRAEIARGESERVPVSRGMLVGLLERRFALSHTEAWRWVDEWCDEHAPATPGYLSNEFGTYWLKIVALANGVIGLAVIGWGVREWGVPRHTAWPWFAMGVLFLGLGGALNYARSFRKA